MAACLSQVHGTPTAALPALPKRLDPLPELLDFLPATAEWSAFREHLQRLENTGFTGAPVLLHGDFWPENLIWRDGRIAGVLDWEDAAMGDPLSDVACASLELRYLYGETGAKTFENAYARRGGPVSNPKGSQAQSAPAASARSESPDGLEPEQGFALDPQRYALWRAYVAAAAQQAMGAWGLEPSREAHMRRVALDSLREAAASLLTAPAD